MDTLIDRSEVYCHPRRLCADGSCLAVCGVSLITKKPRSWERGFCFGLGFGFLFDLSFFGGGHKVVMEDILQLFEEGGVFTADGLAVDLTGGEAE